MNSIEEQLWDYIDGNCTPAEQERISGLLAHNQEYRQQFEALLLLNDEFKATELDEPPMAFTYNVMEQIRTQEALVPLKAGINPRIIYGIATLFILTILAVLVFALNGIKWNSSTTTANITARLDISSYKNLLTGTWMKGFLFFDVVLGLFVLDSYLRKRISHQTNA